MSLLYCGEMSCVMIISALICHDVFRSFIWSVCTIDVAWYKQSFLDAPSSTIRRGAGFCSIKVSRNIVSLDMVVVLVQLTFVKVYEVCFHLFEMTAHICECYHRCNHW